MENSIDKIKSSILSGQPIIQIISFEEKRVEGFLSKLSQQITGTETLALWDMNNGLTVNGEKINCTTDPVTALDYIIKDKTPRFYIFHDITSFLRESHTTVRKFRESYLALKGTKRVLILLSPEEFFSEYLKKETDIYRFELPDYAELESLFNRFLNSLGKSGKVIELSEEEKRNFVIAVQGLTFDEAYKAFMKAFQGANVIEVSLLEKIHEEKKQLILKEGVLEYYAQRFSIEDLGGLDNLKDWLTKREKAFSKEAKAFGLERPRGFLAMGVSGCGKSLSAKITASLWNLPLFRLDMKQFSSG